MNNTNFVFRLETEQELNVIRTQSQSIRGLLVKMPVVKDSGVSGSMLEWRYGTVRVT